jgi:hypothetical protein
MQLGQSTAGMDKINDIFFRRKPVSVIKLGTDLRTDGIADPDTMGAGLYLSVYEIKPSPPE